MWVMWQAAGGGGGGGGGGGRGGGINHFEKTFDLFASPPDTSCIWRG